MHTLKSLSLGLAVLGCNSALAATDLFFSEYVEGSSYNKALEIYNNTGASVDLSQYRIRQYSNGSNTASFTLILSGTLAQGSTFVITHSSAASDLLNRAQQTTGAGLFNGDDAIALTRADGTLVDIIGQIGTDPGSEWGSGLQSTADNTLRRKAGIDAGRTDNTSAFEPSVQWDGFATDTFDGLGAHGGDTGTGTSLGNCGDSATPIHAIQGSGDTSPLASQSLVIEAIVTADFQGSGGLSGFYVQEEPGEEDGDSDTSEGLFVYDTAHAVSVGDQVRIAGTVAESYGQTQLGSISAILACGTASLPAALSLSLPWSSADAAEAFEGMHVHFPQTLIAAENYNLARYGELVLSSARPMIPTQIAAPGTAASAVAAAHARDRITLDDNSNVQNPDPVIYPNGNLTALDSLRAGDSLAGLSGILGYGFSAYRLYPTATPQFQNSNIRPLAATLPDSDQVRIASFNVLNYFNGPDFPTARGASTAEEFQRQRAKTLAALQSLNADIIGLMELENDGFGSDSALQDLVSGLGSEWQFANPGTGVIGSDEITVGLIYRNTRVQPVGSAVTTSSGAFADKNRQPLLQSFRRLNSGDTFSVVVNHFKSKGSCPTDGSSNQDQGDGQGCWNPTRVAAATDLAQWIASNPNGQVDEDVIIIGDLNAYAQEDPITHLQGLGYTNLIDQHIGNGAAYSYVYSAESGYLDHALATAALTAKVQQVEELHINADEPRALDYNQEYKSAAQIAGFYNPDPYRSSDHDPLRVDMQPVEKAGDLDRDGDVDSQDAHRLRQRLNTAASGSDDPCDLNQDGRISIADLRKLTTLCTRTACAAG